MTDKTDANTPAERDPYDRAARRLADNNANHAVAPDALDGDGQRYPLLDDIARATYPDPKAAHLKGESPVLEEKRVLAEFDRNNDDENPITRLPDGTPADNTEAIAHNEAKDAEARNTIDVETGDDEQADIDRRRDRKQEKEPASGPQGAAKVKQDKEQGKL